ncbi:hypothetical protein [Arcobacter arenosus]|uniref:Uncharacterized protein n=1 Tax=Arcobacter arenosus TaxID=2576037 RepID=A0A5R8XY63_9BACT|nr:hypothetical protein [Arcobacter arenosus]TLP36163.1 hypothetical protein FDK22_12885 [Arcobacter arenosus]
MRLNNLDNPFFIVLLAIAIVIVNTISSIIFFPILTLGILFMAFFVCLKKRYYYSFTVVILALTFIELNNGFKPLSLFLLATFVYVFLVPNINRIFTFSSLNSYIYMTVFYLGVTIVWSIDHQISFYFVAILVINLIIDFILFGVLI